MVSSPPSQATSLWHRASAKAGGESQDDFSHGCRRKQLLCHYRYSLEKKKRKEVAKSSISEVRRQQFGNKLIKSHHSNLFTKSERSSHVHM